MNKSASLEYVGLLGCLLQDNLIDFTTAKEIAAAIKKGTALTNYLVKNNILSSDAILHYCANKFALPIYYFDMQNPPSLSNHDTISIELIYRYRVVPFNHEGQLYVGVTDPTDHAAINAISFHADTPIKLILVAEDDVEKMITAKVKPNILNFQLETVLSQVAFTENISTEPEVTEKNDEPVIAFVDKIIRDAIENKISDIHIEPYSQHCRIRFRRDGMLYEATVLPNHLAARITTRLKIMAQLNIAERRLPQDGRILLNEPRKINIRVNTCPTLFGEKMVLRILTMNNMQIEITSLGLTSLQEKLLLQYLQKPQGLILVTGPTGSGKTMTLYAALNYLNQIEKNTATAEDPIEIELQGINQINVNPKIHLDFATILRSILRQDPDIIMVGEIRDNETAGIAIQAAQTGHLVLSTLHTNSALETLTRLGCMGISAYNIVSSTSLMIAQRLVRKLCSHCKIMAQTGDSISYLPVGCDQCHQGYQGRIAIFEIIPMTKELARLVLANTHLSLIAEYIQKENWLTLWKSALLRVNDGTTSFEEIMRVVGGE